MIFDRNLFTYDAAGNITDAPNSCYQYDTNNRLITFNGNTVSYDMDGNMLNNGVKSFTYDSANRLITAGGHTYTYDAADVRIRNLCAEEDTSRFYLGPQYSFEDVQNVSYGKDMLNNYEEMILKVFIEN